MKELDLLLLAWLEGHWHSASSEQREAFTQILDLPDPQIAGYLLGHAPCSEDPVASLVAALRRLASQPRQGDRDTSPRNTG